MPAEREPGGGRGLKALVIVALAFSAFLASSLLTSKLSGSVAGAHAAPRSKAPPCQAAFPDARRKTIGRTTWYNRQESVRMVLCYRFGLNPSADFPISSSMICGVLAQVIGKGSAKLGVFADGACSGADLASDPKEPVKYISTACGWASDLLGVFVKPLGALASAGCTLAPSTGDAFGGALESKHEFDVAVDVIRHGQCIKYSPTHVGSPWLAARCAGRDKGFSILPLHMSDGSGAGGPGGSDGGGALPGGPVGGGSPGGLPVETEQSTVTAPLPYDADGFGQLNSVSCALNGFCAAVGDYLDQQHHLQGVIESAGGAAWLPVQAPSPTDSSNTWTNLTSIDCSPSGTCAAIGKYQNDEGIFEGVIETLVGDSWIARTAPLPANAHKPGAELLLSDIACPGTGECKAIGSYENDQEGLSTVVETFSDGNWEAEEMPWPSGVAPAAPHSWLSLYSLSCTSSTSCFAGGYYNENNPGFAFQPSVAGFGGSWSNTIAVQVPSNTESADLASVACKLEGQCFGVGYYQDFQGNTAAAVVEPASNGWQLTAVPPPSDAYEALEVSTLSAADCAAEECLGIGLYRFDEYHANQVVYPLEKGYVERQASGEWGPVSIPLPADARTTPDLNRPSNPILMLKAVRCSTASCLVLGEYMNDSGVTQGLIDKSDHGLWTSTQIPVPTNLEDGARCSPASAAWSAARGWVVVGSCYGSEYSGLITVQPIDEG
jgi:hypothetical protein